MSLPKRSVTMIRCEQKYCKNCVKPYFSLDGKFCFGYCKASKYLILKSDKNSLLDVQPLYCHNYIPRVRKINY